MSLSTGVEVAARCHRCGAATSDARAFRRSPGLRGWRRECPTCAGVRSRRMARRLVVVVLAGIPVALVGDAVVGPSPVWQVVALFSGFYLIAEAQVVPHEAGHAFMAGLCGFRVFRVELGEGRSVAEVRLGGTVVEVRALPMGGATWSSTDDPRRYRLRRTLVVAAGPVVTAAIAGLAWRWPTEPGTPGDAVRWLVVVTAAVVLVTNLVPWRPTRGAGRAPTDGWQLVTTPWLSDAEVAEAVDLHARLDVVEHARRREWEAALAGARRVVEGAPGDVEARRLLVWALGGSRRWVEAADVARAALAMAEAPVGGDGGTGGSARVGGSAAAEVSGTSLGVLCNDLAWSDLMTGDAGRLDEADRCSARAVELVGWLPGAIGTRGAVLVARGRLDEGLSLLAASVGAHPDRRDRALNRCFSAIGEARRGDVAAARRHLSAAERDDADCELLPRARAVVADAALDRRS